MDLTLHRRACGLWEEGDEQEVDEVDEGQDIVPEQASCRDTQKEMQIHLSIVINNNKESLNLCFMCVQHLTAGRLIMWRRSLRSSSCRRIVVIKRRDISPTKLYTHRPHYPAPLTRMTKWA